MKNKKSNVTKRREDILNKIKENENIKVDQLAEEMKVSPITVRRDLQVLEREGHIERKYGSVRIANINANNVSVASTDIKNNAIMAIASYAARNMIENNDTIFMNSGFTVKNICSFIPRDKYVTIVTNNLRIAEMDLPHNISVMLTGGEISRNNRALVGEFAIPVIKSVMAAKALIGVNGISFEGGLTTDNAQTVVVAKNMFANCIGPKIVVADHSKIGKRLNFHFSSINDISCIVTDNKASQEELKKFESIGIKVIVVNPEE